MLVIGKIVSGANSKKSENLAQRGLVIFGSRFRSFLNLDRADIVFVSDNLRRNLPDIQNRVNQIGRNRIARHLAKFGLTRILHENRAAAFLDALQTHRTVRARSAQNDANRPFLMRFRQPAKEKINRSAPFLSADIRLDDDMTVEYFQVLVRRHDVDVIRLDLHPFINLFYGNLRRRLQNFRQMTFVVGRQMQNNDICHARIGGNIFKKLLESLNAARRRADADDEKIFGRDRRAVFRFDFLCFRFFHNAGLAKFAN